MISVVILTLNEQQDLPGCLDSLQWADDIHIVDSGSIDLTLDIAKRRHAKIYYNKFTNKFMVRFQDNQSSLVQPILVSFY